ncbi:GGDEF domain-containing protein [Blastochloris tepida]|jgi:diguanylate cyclase|uniref:diguanylate cyclase n=1 Tax=Blastochloris tepida TaxID=2233851 RepID=A0A348G104_9HYPH|nr:GGDEF domain-containing protein [Blastochloris tepida]BBF93237.1 GGDEF domain-containing protein [Blastochloris tepida]
MDDPKDDFERSLAFADIAMGQMKALRQPAYPRNYEVWYTYATGQNLQLNAAVNEVLAKGSFCDQELGRIYEELLSPHRFTETIDQVGVRVMNKIGQVLAMVQIAAGDVTQYSESLADATNALVRAGADSESLHVIVESLVESTREMEARNRVLQDRLNDSNREISLLKQNLEAARTESLTDPLTTLANRKYLDMAITRLMADGAASGEPLSVLITDIDNFKKFNDTFGHLTGDQVLRLVAMAVKQNVKGQDVAARYGGEEFMVLLPRTTTQHAITVAEHIRKAVMGKELMKRSTGESLGRITISIGVATMRPGDTAASLIDRADSHLYAAKRAGRNRVSAETEAQPSPAKVA